MQNSQHTEEEMIKRYIEGRKAALVGFFILILGGVALVGIGTPLHNPLLVLYGLTVVMASPVFLTIAVALRRKLKKLGL